MTYKEIYEKAASMLDRGEITLGDFNKMVEPLNSEVQSEPHWIPVTERPKERMICYVTLKDTKDESRHNWVAEMIYTPWDGFDLMDGIEAIAWMPKKYPEPYKG